MAAIEELSHLDSAVAYPDGSISFRIVTQSGKDSHLKLKQRDIENVLTFLASIAVASAEITGQEELSPTTAINHTAPPARDLQFSAPPGRPVILTIFVGNTQLSVSLTPARLLELSDRIHVVSRTLSAEQSRHGAN